MTAAFPPASARPAGDRRVKAWIAALELAMRAKRGEADDAVMRLATVATIGAFDAADPVVVAVRDIGRDWPLLRLRDNAELLSDAGDKLLRAVTRSSWPSQSGRADLEG